MTMPAMIKAQRDPSNAVRVGVLYFEAMQCLPILTADLINLAFPLVKLGEGQRITVEPRDTAAIIKD